MIEVRESSDEHRGPFFLFDSATEMVLTQGIRDRQLAEEIAHDVNPGGRPKKKPLTEALERIYADPKEAMAAARALAKKARKGSIAHFQEAANRVEGRIPNADESRGDVAFNVVISTPRPHRPA